MPDEDKQPLVLHRSHPSTVTCVRAHGADGESENDHAVIEGLASVFYDGTEKTEYQLWSDTVERIMPTAFDRALKEKDDVRGLFNHDPSEILGRTKAGTMKLSKSKEGLTYRIDAPQSAGPLVEAIKRGDVSGSSFSFIIDELTWREEKVAKGVTRFVREINSVQLFDVGPVTFPAYDQTTTQANSHLPEHVARDNGLGLVQARALFYAWRESVVGDVVTRRHYRERCLQLLQMAAEPRTETVRIEP